MLIIDLLCAAPPWPLAQKRISFFTASRALNPGMARKPVRPGCHSMRNTTLVNNLSQKQGSGVRDQD